MNYILVIIALILFIVFCNRKFIEEKESYMRFNTFPKSDSGFIQKLGGLSTIAQNQDLPLITDDQNPLFWSLDASQLVYNRQL